MIGPEEKKRFVWTIVILVAVSSALKTLGPGFGLPPVIIHSISLAAYIWIIFVAVQMWRAHRR